MKLISIITPHFSQEIAFIGGLKKDLSDIPWPVVDHKVPKSKEVNIVVQINGKKKYLISANENITQNELIKIIKNDKSYQSIEVESFSRVIFVQNKIINFVK
jgi:Leucyl-tRNA synthetase